MAGMREMALGIASAIQTGLAPNPLPVELKGCAAEDVVQLVKCLIHECVDASIAIKEIRVDQTFIRESADLRPVSGLAMRGVVITSDAACLGRLEIYCGASESGEQHGRT